MDVRIKLEIEINDKKNVYILNHRPTWSEWGVLLAIIASTRSNCLSRQTGSSLFAPDHSIIAVGYNGPPSGFEHCEDCGGCIRRQMKIPSGERMELSRAIHAEKNVIINCAKHGASTDQSILCNTTFPCIGCAKEIVQSGMQKVAYLEDYGDKTSRREALNILTKRNVELEKVIFECV